MFTSTRAAIAAALAIVALSSFPASGAKRVTRTSMLAFGVMVGAAVAPTAPGSAPAAPLSATGW